MIRCRLLARLLPLLLLLPAALSAAGAAPIVVVDEHFQRSNVLAASEFRVEAGARPLAELAADDAGWQPRAKPPGLAYSTDSLWQRFTVRRTGQGPARLRLEIANPMLDQLDIHVLAGNTVVRNYLLGDTRPAANREFPLRHFVVLLELPPGESRTIYLRASSLGVLKLPVTLWDEQAFIASEQRALIALSVAYGAILSALLVFLVIARNSREPGFHAALLFMLVVTAYQAHVDGVMGQFLPIDGTWWNQYKTTVLGMLAAVAGTLCAARMLELPARLPATRHLLRGAWLGYGVLAPLALFAFGERMLPAFTAAMLLFAVGSVLLGGYALYRRLPRAGTYTALMALFLVGAGLSGLDRAALLPTDAALHTALMACILLQLAVLGYVLVQQALRERGDRLAAEAQALNARKRALAAEWHMAYELEREVERQTEALSQTMKELREANRQLADMSLHDGLTGLHNRRHFDERYPALIQLAARRQEPLAVMMLDVDFFKKVNDEHGHLVGDDCLRQVAATLRRVLGRSTDLLARYGGEEFVIVLPATGEAESAVIAERIRSAVEATPVPNGGQPLNVSVSIGVAVRVPAAADGIDLLRDADAALYRAKKNGRNRVERG